MVTVLKAVTDLVVIVKVALVEPAATVTLAGTEATDELLLDNVTAVADEGAALRTTVP